MGCRIISGYKDGNKRHEAAVLYDSVTETAFGPVFDSHDQAEAFMEWLSEDTKRWTHVSSNRGPGHDTSDPRAYDDYRLAELHAQFLRESERVI